MEENRKKDMIKKFIIGFTIAIFSLSCSITKESLNSDKKVEKNYSEVSEDHQLQKILGIDSVHTFSCESQKINLTFKNLNWYHFPDNLSRCLYTHGYNGSKEANRQIALLVDLLGYEFVSIFGNRKDFRGPEIFEALLRRAEHPHKRSAHLYYAKQMIATIDNFSGSDIDKYVKKVNDLPEFVVVTAKGSKGDPEWEAIRFRTIKKAWEDGKIVLKSFGQE